ncbi:MAG: isochorismatase family protein [Actinobacteria bacterium]|nr:isochorismatase family protein [Actinomycetota bacterium]MSX35672.1 isochorismatase family protein [Actinomycetota bacterium]
MDEKQMNRLAGLLIAETTAVLTMELQNGVVGAGALMKALVDEVERVGVRATAGRLCTAARVRGIQVVHCVAENRPDGRGATDNCKVFAMNNRLRRETGSTPIDQGTVGVKLVAELGPDERDIVVPRIHGLTPFTQTSLDQILRNMSIRTLVVTGVSVNMGIFGTVMSAVDLGYNVIIVRDGVCGVPREYSDAVLENSLSLLATIASADDVIAAWG